MKEKCLIDTTILLRVILEGDFDILKKLSSYILFLPVNVLEETSFKIVVSSVLDDLGIENCSF